jgi:hypothetical protein
MNDCTLLLMSLLMAQGAPEVAILDTLIKGPAKENVLLIHDTLHESHFGSLASFTALKEAIEAKGYKTKVLTTKEIHNVKGAPLDLVGFQDPAIFAAFYMENPEFIKSLESVDSVIINGGGAIHGASAYALKLLYFAYIAKVFFLKNVQIINHSVYPQSDLELDELIICRLYKEVYDKMDFVAIRERLSSSLMKILGTENRQSFDMLPLYIQQHYTKPKRPKNRIVIADSLALTAEGLESLMAYMQTMQGRGFEVVVLSEHTKCQTDFGPWTYIHPATIEEWLDIVNDAALVVSGRFHLSIAAMCLKTPMIILSSDTPKNKALTDLSPSINCLNLEDPNLYANLLGKTHYLMTSTFDDLELPDLKTLTTYANYNLLMLKDLGKSKAMMIPVKSG